MKYRNEITAETNVDELVEILKKEINDTGYYDTVHLNDILKQLDSPLLIENKYGDRKLKQTVQNKLKKVIDIKYDNGDKCWYKI